MPTHPSASIAPTARVDSAAHIGPRSRVADFCVVEADVVIGAECVLDPYVYVKRWTTLGDRNRISAGAVLGSDPLDRAFRGDRSYLVIGNDNQIREHFTISRATRPEGSTVIGHGNFVMTSGHIAHDCKIGDKCVIASCALVAGHVEMEDQVFVSGGVVIHQFSRIGRLAMIGGNTRVNSDLPPYFLYTDFDVAARGLNLVGLQRAGFTRADISALKAAYRLLYRAHLPLSDALQRIETEIDSEHARHLVEFIRGSQRGICREPRGVHRNLSIPR